MPGAWWDTSESNLGLLTKLVKLLVDTCISGAVREALQAAGHDVIWTGDWPEDPGDDEFWTMRINKSG